MKIEQFIKIIEKETKEYLEQQKKEKMDWTSDDFKLINRFKHRLIMRFEDEN